MVTPLFPNYPESFYKDAIPVTTVEDEFFYLDQHYPDHAKIKQILFSHIEKYYDIFLLKSPEGKIVELAFLLVKMS